MLRNFFQISRFIFNHPLASKNRMFAFRRFFSWQISQKLVRQPVLYSFVENSSLLMEKGMAGATGNVYTGLHEFEDMAFALHVLRPGDLFGDIGANIGAYTILATKNAGARAISVEPIPSTFARLKQNVELNRVSQLATLFECGIGSEPGTLRFTSTSDTVNHVLPANESRDDGTIVEVPVRTLDGIFEGEDPVILKMDVEGFEWPALLGGARVMGAPSLKALIIELNGSGTRYGYDDASIHQLLSAQGFKRYSYDPFGRAFTPLAQLESQNGLYIRDLDWAADRCRTARRFKVLQLEV